MPMDQRLYMGIKKDDKKVVEEYKEQFATQLTANKSTVLHVAAESKDFNWEDSTDFLAMVGLDMLFSLNSNGDTCIHLAAKAANCDAVKAIINFMNNHENFGDIESDNNLQGARALLRITNKDGNTGLHLAARGKIARLLVKADADFSYPPNNMGKSALYVAAEEGNEDAGEYILNECTSPSYAGPYGTTALHAAVISRSEFCMELLLKKKPSLTKQADNFGWNPLHYAACNSDCEAIVRKLLLADKEMAYETIKEHNMTPLHIAAIKGELEAMKEIVEQCPDCLDAVTSQGQNVLHLAYLNKEMIYSKQNLEMVFFLKDQLWLYDLSNQRDADGNEPDYATEKTVLSHPLLKLKSSYDDDDKASKAKDDEGGINTETANTHLIVATLILTISFAAGFTIPGGFRSSDGPNEGIAILGKKAAFKAFAITDTIAMITSSSAVFLHYLASLESKLEKKKDRYAAAALLVLVAMIAMMIVFMTGLYVMLPSTSLAVFICVTCSLSLIFFIFIFVKTIKGYDS